MISPYIQSLATELKNNGIEYAFGIVGSGPSIQLVTALESLGVPFFPVAHEGSAVYLAGAASIKGKARGVAISIKGPGFANFIPALLSNYYENLPSISISEAFNDNIPHFKKHKRLNQKHLCMPVTKAYGRGNLDKTQIRQLFEIAEGEAPGPVHIDLCDGKAEVSVFLNEETKATQNATALNLIGNAKKPLVVFGALAARKIPLDFSIDFPFCTTTAAKSYIDENHPYYAGIASGEAGEFTPETTIMKEADLIIGIGLRNTELVDPAFPTDAKHVLIDEIKGDLQDGFKNAEMLYTENISAFWTSIQSLLKNKSWGKEKIAGFWKEINVAVNEFSWTPANVYNSLQKSSLKNEILCLDTGLFCILGETLWKSSDNNNIRINGNSKFMGTSVPYAIGKAIGNPNKKVICAAGDGGIRPYLPEIKIAIENKLNILFLLFADGKYGTIARGCMGKDLSPLAMKIALPEWSGAMEKIGCPSAIVKNTTEFESALKKFENAKGPYFIECLFDVEDYRNVTLRIR